MLAKRIIPTVLCRGRQMVKGIQFNSWRSVGLAAQAVRVHSMRGVDELVLLDIAATAEGRGPDLKLVEELSETCFMPLAVGGGIRSVTDIKNLLRAGADKVVIGTGLYEVRYEQESLVHKAAETVGAQAIVASIDIKGGWAHSHCGKKNEHWIPTAIIRLVECMGAGEILLNSIDHEGTLEGYDLDLIRQVSEKTSIPVIACGGAGTYEHLRQAIEAGADAVAAGALFQFTDATPKGAAEYLQAHGIEVRI